MSQHSGFDLTATDVIREVDGAFEDGTATSSLTVVTQHTKAFRAPVANDWWEITIFGTITGVTDAKHVWINFDTDTLDIAAVSADNGDFIITFHLLTDGSGNASLAYHFNPAPATGTSQVVEASSAVFPTTAGNLVIQANVDNAGDSIEINGVIIRSGGSA